MTPSRGLRHLKLGPIVGHTDHESARVWIQAYDDPGNYELVIRGVGNFSFVSTETPGRLEFCTGLAVVKGLKPDWRYRYIVKRLRRTVINGRGSFRTMPSPSSMANLSFVLVSCNSGEAEGVWQALNNYIQKAQPQFLLMVGDQLYLDEGEPDLFDRNHRDLPSDRRRELIAEKYRANWSRDAVREVFANLPVYMMWDDHDIRDGWGSSAPESPTLAARYPRGVRLHDTCRAYFEDCRDLYWHFQACHNPPESVSTNPSLPNYIEGPPFEDRQAMPFVFRCGRLMVLVLDSRGERDVFRQNLPILGATQWDFISTVFANLPADVDALAVVTPTPIASMDPESGPMHLLGDRTDDIELFKVGDTGALSLQGDKGTYSKINTILNYHFSNLTRPLIGELNQGSFQINNLDEVRDQWSHKFSRAEQIALLKASGRALRVNRPASCPRELIFLSGDIHVGARYLINSTDPNFEAWSLTSSGISTVVGPPTLNVILSDDFEVAPGIRSDLREVVLNHNFGVVEVVPTGIGADIQASIVHRGFSSTWGLDLWPIT